MSMLPRHRRLAGALATLATLLALAGCSTAPLTAPPATSVATPGVVAPLPPSRLSASDNLQLQLPLDSLLAPVLRTVTAVLVPTGVDTVVTGDRYTLKFAKGSLVAPTSVTIQDIDANVLDVTFGPHGTRFATPVELSIDFAGTNCDPGKNYANAEEPVLYYLNETTNQWEVVPGVTDWVHLKHIVHLEHFSRYVLGGKAGWKQAPPRDDGE